MIDDRIVADREPMRSVVQSLLRFAQEGERIIVYGESGVGVGWLCGWVHRHSPRRDGPFVVVSLPAIPASGIDEALYGKHGAVRAARGGTLLVRGIDELDPRATLQLLSSIGPGTRVVATCYSNSGRIPERSLDPAVLAKFAATVEVPPLRDRREDIPSLVALLRDRVSNIETPLEVSPDQLAELEAHDWPGNVRELMLAVTVICAGYPLSFGRE